MIIYYNISLRYLGVRKMQHYFAPLRVLQSTFIATIEGLRYVHVVSLIFFLHFCNIHIICNIGYYHRLITILNKSFSFPHSWRVEQRTWQDSTEDCSQTKFQKTAFGSLFTKHVQQMLLWWQPRNFRMSTEMGVRKRQAKCKKRIYSETFSVLKVYYIDIFRT